MSRTHLVCGNPLNAGCLAWALAVCQAYGIWGGLSEDQRAGPRRAAARRGDRR